ncbi:MAG: hypothetical protein Q8S75_20515, partial [Nitrospirota bacterium]|nr:hypothetical protein [Nitrospirota bacterium]
MPTTSIYDKQPAGLSVLRGDKCADSTGILCPASDIQIPRSRQIVGLLNDSGSVMGGTKIEKAMSDVEAQRRPSCM